MTMRRKLFIPAKPALILPRAAALARTIARDERGSFMLTGVGGPKPAAAAAGPVLTHITTLQLTGAGGTYNFAATDIGTAAADRLVIVSVQCVRSSATGARSLTSITIGGSAASIAISGTAFSQLGYGIGYLAVASGTTADIVVTANGAFSTCQISVWSLTGQNSNTPVDAQIATPGNEASLALNVTGTGVLVAVGGGQTAGNVITWTGATKLDDSDANGLRLTDAHATGLSTEVGRTIGLSSASASEAVAAASWH